MISQDPQGFSQNNSSSEEELANPIKSGWYDDPEGSGGLRWFDAKSGEWSKEVTAAAEVNLESDDGRVEQEETTQDSVKIKRNTEGYSDKSDQAVLSALEEWENKPSEILGLPVLENWKPAPLFSALGVAAGFFLQVFTGLLFDIPIVATIYAIAVILYAVIVYKSFYTSKPLIRSSKVISFLNYLVGWVIFGWCWNRNLNHSHLARKPKKGISYVVFTIFYALILAMCLYIDAINLLNPGLNDSSGSSFNSSYANKPPSNTGDELTQLADTSRFIDEEYGVSFVMPSGWSQEAFNEKRTYLRWKAAPDDGSSVGITYGVEELPFNGRELTTEDFRGLFSRMMENCEDEVIEKVKVGETTFFKISGSGTKSSGSVSVPISCTVYYATKGDALYMFQYIGIKGDPDTASYYDDFISLVSSIAFDSK